MKRISLPSIPEKDRSPAMNMLLKVIEQQQTIIQKLDTQVTSLKAEIKRLKKHKQKPKIPPSKMDGNSGSGQGNSGKKRRDSKKRKKTDHLSIDKTEIIKAEEVPAEAEFKGYKRWIVQDIELNTVNTEYQLEQWRLPDGSYVTASLPSHQEGHHFGPTLRSYILHQYHHQQVTQPLLLDQLKEWGVDISSGQLNRLLIEDKEPFHQEKAEVLQAGLSASQYIHVDDTGARHRGKNGYCTHIGNELFAWFESTAKKSRINFLELLRAGHSDYRIDESAVAYMKKQRLPKKTYSLLAQHLGSFDHVASWEAHLKRLGITNPRHCRIATEGALVGSVLSHGFNIDLVIVSDDAGQFNIFQHALCWIHAERKINELIPMTDLQAAAVNGIRRFFWQFYDDLKIYKKNPSPEQKRLLSQQFDVLLSTETCFETLNQVLKRLKKNKTELLMVLERPDIPLHNNLSERDIREYVKRRKVSGSTRSKNGRHCRDTFASLKKTCKKLGVGFWNYLQDRLHGKGKIPPLSDLLLKAGSKQHNTYGY